MNVLSLFDGMSCGQIALNKANVKYETYYASEIDKYAIAVTQHNYPKTIQIGDIKTVSGYNLPEIDLIIGGSPCQGFSFAGKQLNFNDYRSKLFFEYIRILNECKAKNSNIKFLLENVRMKKEYQNIISQYLGVEPVIINSSLVSAQNRVRLYWTNINNGYIKQPQDKQIFIKDIIEYGTVDKSNEFDININFFNGALLTNYFIDYDKQLVFEKPHGNNKGGCSERLKFHTLRCCTGYNYAIYDRFEEKDTRNKNMYIFSKHLNDHKYHKEDNHILVYTIDINRWRKLTPVECERLQTVPDNYTLVTYKNRIMSNSQRYRMLGNGWTIDVIIHIFNYLK